MDYHKIKSVSIILLITGVIFIFSQFQGITGFVIGEELGISFNVGIIIIILGISIYFLTTKVEKSGFLRQTYRVAKGEINSGELRKQRLQRSTRELYIEMYAKEPTTAELDQFIMRLVKEGKLTEIV